MNSVCFVKLVLRDLILLVIARSSSVTVLPMPSTTVGELRERLLALGETAPRSWTGLQIKARIAALKEERQALQLDAMEEEMKVLKKAARKKSDLQMLLDKESVTFNQSDTISIMFNRMEKVIREKYEPQDTEMVGFGAHAELTYKELMETNYQYLLWCETTVGEGQANWRMQRLVKWFKTQKTKVSKQGYPKQPPVISTPRKTAMARASHVSDSEPSDFSVISHQDEISRLQAELAKVRQEKAELQEENTEMSRTLDRTKTRKEM